MCRILGGIFSSRYTLGVICLMFSAMLSVWAVMILPKYIYVTYYATQILKECVCVF